MIFPGTKVFVHYYPTTTDSVIVHLTKEMINFNVSERLTERGRLLTQSENEVRIQREDGTTLTISNLCVDYIEAVPQWDIHTVLYDESAQAYYYKYAEDMWVNLTYSEQTGRWCFFDEEELYDGGDYRVVGSP